MATGIIQTRERLAFRFDKLGLIIAILVLYGALLAPFATFRANRIIQGEARAILEALPPPLGYGLLALVIAGAGVAFLRTPRLLRMAVALAALAALALLIGVAADHLTPPDNSFARVSPASGFWVLVFAFSLLVADALTRLNPGPGLRLLVFAGVLVLAGGMLVTGRWDDLSIVKEYANRSDLFWTEAGRHVTLALGSLVAATVVGLPLGILCHRVERLRAGVLNVLNAIQTIPSIALFGILIAPLGWVAANIPGAAAIGIRGIGAAPAFVALFLYSLLPVVANTVVGLAGVPHAANGRGAGHRHDGPPAPRRDRVSAGLSGDPDRHPHRAGAEHRACDDRRPYWRRGFRRLRLPGGGSDGDGPGAARRNSDCRAGLYRGDRARRADRDDHAEPQPRQRRMIEIEEISKRYGDTTVVSDVSLTVAPHTVTVVVGTSGSGKTTLLRMINRLVEPTAGTIKIDGEDNRSIPGFELRRRIGYAIQGHGLFPHRTVAQNIATVPTLLGWEKARIDAKVEELLKLFQLDPSEFGPRYPHELSGGQQQRVGVARALAAEPNVLLMDEPFGALDPIIRAKAQDDLAAIQKHFGTTIILVTHDMEEAFHLADRIAVMDKGEVVQYATPAEMLVRPATPFVETLVGASERPFRLLDIETVGEAVEPGSAEGRPVPEVLSQRDALSELLWTGRSALPVAAADGAILGKITLEAIVKRAARRQ
ncbi:ABC-type proline/glycine betaine transport system ATPase subunit [Sinorhizobium meliloti]